MTGKMFTLFLILILLSAPGLTTPAGQGNSPAEPDQASPSARYACPMHSKVTAAKAGNCSKCGMALRLVGNERENKNEVSAKPVNENNPATTKEAPPLTSARIPDSKVYDQTGQARNFYTDLIKGKTVAINFIFTTCTTICPPLTATFRRVQQNLAADGIEAQLISVSVDPTTDTTERLRAFANKFGAGPDWAFVTGNDGEIKALLQALGADIANKNDHTPMILIGNEASGYWTRAYGLSSPTALVKVITKAANHK